MQSFDTKCESTAIVRVRQPSGLVQYRFAPRISTGAPQSGQNLAPALTGLPHLGQTLPKGFPQSGQNLAEAETFAPQEGQVAPAAGAEDASEASRRIISPNMLPMPNPSPAPIVAPAIPGFFAASLRACAYAMRV